MKLYKFAVLIFLSSFSFTINSSFSQTTSLAKRLDSLYTSYLDSGFAGAVLVSEKDKVTLRKGYGFSDNSTQKLNTPSTLFNVASIGKQFTAYSILLLEKKGLLNTSDLLFKYIGKFNDERDSVTIHHLLLHSSGLFNSRVNLDYNSRAGFIQSVKDSGAEAKAGEQYRYSNAGFTMLAAVVEIVSGESFETFLWKNIFKPFKLKHTGYPWEARINKNNLATGYNNKHQPMPSQNDFWGARGPGNLVTTVDDLNTWIRALNNPRKVAAEIKAKMFYDHQPGKESYSWSKAVTSRKTRLYHKGGGRNDFENRMLWYPDDEVLIMFCENNDYNIARSIFKKIIEIMN